MGVAVGAAVFVLSGWLLLRAISSFRRTWADAVIARVPAAARQTIRISADGEMGLYLEGPRFGTWARRCRYTCVDAATGTAVEITPSFSGSGVRSRRYSRVRHGRLVLPRAGDYVLEVAGLQPSEAPDYAVVFMRLQTRQLIGFILTCVALGMLLVGSLVLSILSAVL